MGVTVRWIALGGLALACCPIAAQDCPRLETSLPFGRPTRVAVLGEVAYFGIGRGVMAVDGSDPTSLRVVARLPLPGEVRDIAVEGSRAYVAMGEAGVQVLDLTDPARPRPLAVIDTPGEARGVDVGGGWLVVADGPAGLCSIPLASPGAAACVSTGQYTLDVAVEGAIAVALAGGIGLAVVDLDTPGGPLVVASLPMPNSTAVALEGDLAAVSCGDDGLRVVDLSQPAQPAVVGALDVPEFMDDVDLRGRLACVAATDYVTSRLRIVDLSDPSQPVEIGSLGSPASWRTLDIATAGERVFLAETRGMRMADLSDPSDPTELGRLHSDRPVGLEVSGDLGFVAFGTDPERVTGVTILDLADPDHPADLVTLSLPSPGKDLVAGGSFLYVGQGETLRIFDVSVPVAPVEVGSLTNPCSISHLALEGSLLVVAGRCGLRMVDVAAPAAPTVVGVLDDLPGSGVIDVESLLARGDHVYVGLSAYLFVSSGTLAVADVSNPSSPAWVATEGSGIPFALALDHDRLSSLACHPGFQGWDFNAMEVWDVSSPSSPMLTGQGFYPVVGCITQADLEPHAGLTYLMAGGVIVYDPLAPWNPEGISRREPGWAVAGEFARGRLLVADLDLGVLVLDPSCVGSLFADGFEAGDPSRWSFTVP